jgi:hypothetical protein
MPTNDRDPETGSVTPDTPFDTYDRDELSVLGMGLVALAAAWTTQAVYLLFFALPYLVRRFRRG